MFISACLRPIIKTRSNDKGAELYESLYPKQKTMILSLSIIAFLFLSAVVIALLFNDVTPAAMLAV